MEKKRHSSLGLWYRRIVGIFAVFFLLHTPTLFAEKTDVVVLKNGDRITGEIKKLERGRLEFKTDDMGWIYIDWKEIVKISSQNQFDVEMETGQRHIGSIQEASESGKMIVATEEGPVTLNIISVVKITPIESLFKERFKGYIDFGFTLERANKEKNLTFGTEVAYRTIKWETKTIASSYVSTQESVEDITRHSLSLSLTRLMKKRWQATLMIMAQHNSELELKLRSTLSGGVGRSVIQTNKMLVLVFGGAAVQREQAVGSDEIQVNLELLTGLTFQAFRFDHPKLDSTVNLKVFTSITDWGRFRAELDGRIRYELFRDFYITLSLFDHFDSSPPGIEDSGDVSKNDYGMGISLSFSFR
jgi:hypothetical protein